MDEIVEIGAEALFQGFHIEQEDPPGLTWAEHAAYVVHHELYKKAVRDILTALHNQGYAVVKGWQPIETAPKDQTSVLVYGTEGGVWVGCQNIYGDWCLDVADDESADFYLKSAESLGLTHWQPLPMPPTNGAPVDPAKVRHINTPTDTGKEGA